MASNPIFPYQEGAFADTVSHLTGRRGRSGLSNRAGRIEGPSPPQRVGFGEQEPALSLGLVENPSTVTTSPFTRRRACQRPDGRRRTVPVPGRRCARGCYLSLAWPGGRRCRGIGTDGHAEIGHTMAGKVTQRFQRTLDTVTCQP
jgi:hypothetical protein